MKFRRTTFHFLVCLFAVVAVVPAWGGMEEVWRQPARAGAIAVPNGIEGAFVAYTADATDVPIEISGATISQSGRTFLLAKYDAKGAIAWLREFGWGPSPSIIRNAAAITRIRVDLNKNIFLSGHVAGESPTLIGTNSFLSPHFYGNAFLAKFDSEANLLWIRYVPGSDSADFNGLALDSKGNAFVCGQLYGTQTFGSITVAGSGQRAFIAKINPNGEWQWVNDASPGWAFAVAIDPSGNPLITGYTRRDAVNIFGANLAAGSPDPDLIGEIVFVAKFDSRDGRAFWASGARCTAGYALSDIGKDLAILSDGSAYIAGHCIGPARFGSHTLPKTPDVGLLLARISADGEWLWAVNGEGTDYGQSALTSVAVDHENNAYVQGQAVNDYFYGAGGDGIITLAGVNLTNTAFIAKADPAGKFSFATRTRGIGNIQAVDPAGYLYWGGDPGLIKFGPATAPVIQGQPSSTNLVLALNDSAVLEVEVNGAPVYYQWFRNGSALGDVIESRSTNGIHQISYSIAQFDPPQIGGYSLVITNSAGTVTSSLVRLSLAPPEITGFFTVDGRAISSGEPGTQIVVRGMNLEPALALSLGPIDLELGPNTPHQIVTRVPAAYFPEPITITTPGGTAPSPGIFRVLLPSASSQGSSNYFGYSHYFYTPPASDVSFQWFKDGLPLRDDLHRSGSRTNYMTLSNMTTNDTGVYSVLVSLGEREARSIDLPLTLYQEPPKPSELSITGASYSSTLNAGQEATFTITTSGSAPVTFQWFKDGIVLANGGKITGAASETLRISNVQIEDSGRYYVLATVPSGSLASGEMPLTVVAPLIITRYPVDQACALGATATLRVAASGNPPLQYEWKKGGVGLKDDGRITGAADPTLTIHNVSTADFGTYSIRVSDSAGSSATVQVNLVEGPPLLRIHRIVPAGPNTFRLSVRYDDGTPVDPNTLNHVKVMTGSDPGIPSFFWIQLTNVVPLTNGELQLQEPPLYPRRFYVLQTR